MISSTVKPLSNIIARDLDRSTKKPLRALTKKVTNFLSELLEDVTVTDKNAHRTKIQKKPVDINDLNFKELTEVFDSEELAINICNADHKFNNKQDIQRFLGNETYDQFKNRLIIKPPYKLLKISNDSKYLQELEKYNDQKSHDKIEQYRKEFNPSLKRSGYNYIMKWNGDKHATWYKVGMTKKKPQIRANEWGYDLVFQRFTSDRITMEKLLHRHLNFAHSVRPAINGKGKIEIEWFYVSKDILVKTINSIINVYDYFSEHFKFFEINHRSQLSPFYISNKFNHLRRSRTQNLRVSTLRKDITDLISQNFEKNIAPTAKNSKVKDEESIQLNKKKKDNFNRSVNNKAFKILKSWSMEDIQQIEGFGGEGILAQKIYEGIQDVSNYEEFMKKKIKQIGDKRKSNIIDWIVKNIVL